VRLLAAWQTGDHAKRTRIDAMGLGSEAVDMVLEICTIKVRADSEDRFAAAYRQARPILTGTPGCRSVRLTRSVESPGRFYLLVEWDSLESHEHGFRRTDRLPRWRELFEPYYATPPVVEHAVDVPSSASSRH